MKKSKLSNLRFNCEYSDCQKSYTTKQSLEYHVSSHPENQRFQCEYPECRKFFSSTSNLNKHASNVHNNKRFNTIAVLETHLADIDSQIETVAALISGFETFECDDCFLNKWFFNVQIVFAVQRDPGVALQICNLLVVLFCFALPYSNPLQTIPPQVWNEANTYVLKNMPLFWAF